MNLDALSFQEQIHLSILATVVQREAYSDGIALKAEERWRRTFGEYKLPDAMTVEEILNSEYMTLCLRGYIEKQKIIEMADGEAIDISVMESAPEPGAVYRPYLTPEGVNFLESLQKKLKKYLRNKIRYGDRDGIVSIAERVVKSNKVLLAVFLEPPTLYGMESIPFCSMMLASGHMGKDERLFLRMPLLREDESPNLIVTDPSPTFICINAFAIFLAVQGSDIYIPRRVIVQPGDDEEEDWNYYDKAEIETDLYDAMSPPTNFHLFENNDIEEVIKMSKMEE